MKLPEMTEWSRGEENMESRGREKRREEKEGEL
jgi:hypothetical protein